MTQENFPAKNTIATEVVVGFINGEKDKLIARQRRLDRVQAINETMQDDVIAEGIVIDSLVIKSNNELLDRLAQLVMLETGFKNSPDD